MTDTPNRRNFMGKALLGAAGMGAACCLEERILLAALEEDAAGNKSDGQQAAQPQSLPSGALGDLKISRIVLGGNLIGGWAHARDLIYVSQLFKAYNTEAKVFETLELAEQQGINTIQIDPVCQDVVQKYRKERGGKIQTIVCMHLDRKPENMRDEIRRLIDKGATTLYSHGGVTDGFVKNQDIDTMGQAVDLIKKEGLKAGIGGHSLQNVMVSESQNLGADYYVKTLHTDRYWSATPKEERKEFCWQMGPQPDHNEYHDNIFCLNPQETVDYMRNVKKPWFAFKVLAAGAIKPKFGFSYAFHQGADFIIVGMFDFHVVDNTKLVSDIFKKSRKRDRAWYA